MKSSTTLFLILLSKLVFAHAFVVDGTNVVHIQFQDTALTDPQKETIGDDIIRSVTPGRVFAGLTRYANQTATQGHLSRLYKPQTANGTPSLTSEVSVSGTNAVLLVGKDYTDCYLERAEFFTANSNAIAKAFAFANLLMTNSIAEMSSEQINGLRLTKEYAPNQIPSHWIEEIRNDLGAGTYFPPSLLSFQFMPDGPSGSAQYLWGWLPSRTSHEIDSVPIIYYQNRWWISFWHMENGDQTWE